MIGEINAVEREAKLAGIVGTHEHLEFRVRSSRPLFARLLAWARRQRHDFESRSGMSRAIRYILRNFRELGRFLRFAAIPPDNVSSFWLTLPAEHGHGSRHRSRSPITRESASRIHRPVAPQAPRASDDRRDTWRSS
ncbi:MAG: transposase [Myxococcales bacterium]|nr:transposase [Myxococcales bacterium]